MGLLERYRSGEHLAVIEMLRKQPAHDEADAVARELMTRVRANLEVLAERWRDRGFELEAPLGTATDEDKRTIAAIEAKVGRLPVVLRAFYDVIGWIDFVEEPPDDDWPDVEHFDPIQVFRVRLDDDDDDDDDDGDDDDDDDDNDGDGEMELLMCDDELIKFGIGGVGPLYMQLPDKSFDPKIWFEGEPLDGGKLTFVGYLRDTILERGGIGPAAGDDVIGSKLVEELVDGLEPF